MSECKPKEHNIRWSITFGRCLKCNKIFDNEYNADLSLTDVGYMYG